MSVEVEVIETEGEVLIVEAPPEVIEITAPGPQGVQGTQGIQGIQGDPGADGAPGGSYTHAQATPSSLWVINHNLGFHPSVNVIDSGGTLVIGTVTRIDNNNLTVGFTSAFSGNAYLS